MGPWLWLGGVGARVAMGGVDEVDVLRDRRTAGAKPHRDSFRDRHVAGCEIQREKPQNRPYERRDVQWIGRRRLREADAAFLVFRLSRLGDVRAGEELGEDKRQREQNRQAACNSALERGRSVVYLSHGGTHTANAALAKDQFRRDGAFEAMCRFRAASDHLQRASPVASEQEAGRSCRFVHLTDVVARSSPLAAPEQRLGDAPHRWRGGGGSGRQSAYRNRRRRSLHRPRISRYGRWNCAYKAAVRQSAAAAPSPTKSDQV